MSSSPTKDSQFIQDITRQQIIKLMRHKREFDHPELRQRIKSNRMNVKESSPSIIDQKDNRSLNEIRHMITELTTDEKVRVNSLYTQVSKENKDLGSNHSDALSEETRNLIKRGQEESSRLSRVLPLANLKPKKSQTVSFHHQKTILPIRMRSDSAEIEEVAHYKCILLKIKC